VATTEELVETLSQTVDDLIDAGIAPRTILDVIAKTCTAAGARVKVKYAAKSDDLMTSVSEGLDLGVDAMLDALARYDAQREVTDQDPMERVVDRLLKTRSPAGRASTDPPAMECQVFMRSGYKAQGVLSTTPEGALRMMSQGRTEGTSTRVMPVMIEHFFGYADIESVVILHATEDLMAAPRIIQPER
jgi:hypothetical protein